MDIMGIEIGKDIKVSLYADVTVLYIKIPPENFYSWQTLEADSRIENNP